MFGVELNDKAAAAFGQAICGTGAGVGTRIIFEAGAYNTTFETAVGTLIALVSIGLAISLGDWGEKQRYSVLGFLAGAVLAFTAPLNDQRAPKIDMPVALAP